MPPPLQWVCAQSVPIGPQSHQSGGYAGEECTRSEHRDTCSRHISVSPDKAECSKAALFRLQQADIIDSEGSADGGLVAQRPSFSVDCFLASEYILSSGCAKH